eukprot:ANDGO_02704.mRNA.1 Subtilisin-like protease SBT6.1
MTRDRHSRSEMSAFATRHFGFLKCQYAVETSKCKSCAAVNHFVLVLPVHCEDMVDLSRGYAERSGGVSAPALVNGHPLAEIHSVSRDARFSQRLSAVHQHSVDSTGQKDDAVRNLLSVHSSIANRKTQSSLPAHLVGADVLHSLSITGRGTKVAILDSGVSERAAGHINGYAECTNWTSDDVHDCADTVGHGTAVASLIASAACGGIAPDATVYVLKVFSGRDESYTSWMLDALNYVLTLDVDVVNLSSGGPDYLDLPFAEKVREVAAAGISIVVAVGNDGPTWGTVTHPGSEISVIAVGAWDSPVTFSSSSDTYSSDKSIGDPRDVASFSSRGSTVQEFPYGVGRPKPDVLSPGSHIFSLNMHGDKCVSGRGTSLAAPIVTGSLLLLQSSVKRSAVEPRKRSPVFWKRMLMASATRLVDRTVWEQGAGAVDVVSALRLLSSTDSGSDAKLGSFPPKFDGRNEPASGKQACSAYWGVLCDFLPIYPSAQPFILNFTIANEAAVSSQIEYIEFVVDPSETSAEVEMFFEHSDDFWPYTGYIAAHVKVTELHYAEDGGETKQQQCIVKGDILYGLSGRTGQIPIWIPCRATPPRSRRLLFDVYHSMQFPLGYFPRDDLDVKSDMMDWSGDHPLTNYRHFFSSLRSSYFVELLRTPLTCFNASDYGSLIIVDPEDQFSRTEITKLEIDVSRRGLGLLLLADWYNSDIIEKLEFYDKSIRGKRFPSTGGSNLPSLNSLLSRFGIKFGSGVYKGVGNVFRASSSTGGGSNGGGGGGEMFATHSFPVASATEIVEFPEGGLLIPFDGMQNLLSVYVPDRSHLSADWNHRPFLVGMLDANPLAFHGRVSVFTDSGCIDEHHRPSLMLDGQNCFFLVSQLLDFILTGSLDGFSVSNYVVVSSDTIFPLATDAPHPHQKSDILSVSRSLNNPQQECPGEPDSDAPVHFAWIPLVAPRGFLHEPSMFENWHNSLSPLLVAVLLATFSGFIYLFFIRLVRFRRRRLPEESI